MENNRLRYTLDPDLLTALNLKLTKGEITPENCQQLLKQMMITQYIQKHTLFFTFKNSGFVRWISKVFYGLQYNFIKKQPAEPTVSTEELSSWLRARHL